MRLLTVCVEASVSNFSRPIVASTLLAACLAALVNDPQQPESSETLAKGAYLGFDRNDYPGDENLPALRKKFAFAGYWLNKPLGAANNTWIGKRKLVQAAGSDSSSL